MQEEGWGFPIALPKELGPYQTLQNLLHRLDG